MEFHHDEGAPATRLMNLPDGPLERPDPVLVWCSESREAFPFLVNAAFAINRIVTLAEVTRNMLYLQIYFRKYY